MKGQMFNLLLMEKRNKCMQKLLRVAPAMPLKDAFDLTDKYVDEYIKATKLEHVLAVLSQAVIGLNDNGNYSGDHRKCVEWALREVRTVHAGIVCDPFDNMEDYLDRMDGEVTL